MSLCSTRSKPPSSDVNAARIQRYFEGKDLAGGRAFLLPNVPSTADPNDRYGYWDPQTKQLRQREARREGPAPPQLYVYRRGELSLRTFRQPQLRLPITDQIVAPRLHGVLHPAELRRVLAQDAGQRSRRPSPAAPQSVDVAVVVRREVHERDGRVVVAICEGRLELGSTS